MLLSWDDEKEFMRNRVTKLQKTRRNKSIEQNRKLQYNQEDKARGWLDRVTGHFAPVSSPPFSSHLARSKCNIPRSITINQKSALQM